MDAILVNGEKIIPTTQVLGAPDNKAVALLDTGASYMQVRFSFPLLRMLNPVQYMSA